MYSVFTFVQYIIHCKLVMAKASDSCTVSNMKIYDKKVEVLFVDLYHVFIHTKITYQLPWLYILLSFSADRSTRMPEEDP